MNRSIAIAAKAISWFAIINGVISVATPLFRPFPTVALLPEVGALLILALGATSITAGFFGLRKKKWAFQLLLAVYLAQSFEYFSEQFAFSLIGPLAPVLKFGWGWYSPPSHVNLNVVAIAVCFIASRTATNLGQTAQTSISHESS